MKNNKHKHPKRTTVKCTPWHIFKDFAVNTSLHGLKYVGAKSCLIERLFWALTFLLSAGICANQIYKVWEKWNNSPVIVTFSGQNVPVYKVPFPAVTICPQNRILNKYYNYTQAKALYDNLTDIDSVNSSMTPDEIKLFEDLNLVCDLDTSIITEPYDKENGDANTVHNIYRMSPTVSDLFDQCKWLGQPDAECEELFQPILTNEGVCFTFNSLTHHELFRENSIQQEYQYTKATQNISKWSLSDGYDTNNMTKMKEAYPRMGRENRAAPDLAIILHEDSSELDPACTPLYKGFKVYIHHPVDIPSLTSYYFAVLENQETSLAVKFNMITSANALVNYPPKIRQCYFPDDKILKYFSLYSQVNCELECQANYTFQDCDCVWYNMPHNDSNHICDVNKLECVQGALERLEIEEMKASLEAESMNYERNACRCLPACNSTTYDAEVLKTQLNLNAYLEQKFDYRSSMNYSRLAVYYKEARFPLMQRLELFGVTDFLAQCGGLLGVFLGFSFISLVEILYFPTLRAVLWWRNYPLATEDQESGQNELKDSKEN